MKIIAIALILMLVTSNVYAKPTPTPAKKPAIVKAKPTPLPAWKIKNSISGDDIESLYLTAKDMAEDSDVIVIGTLSKRNTRDKRSSLTTVTVSRVLKGDKISAISFAEPAVVNDKTRVISTYEGYAPLWKQKEYALFFQDIDGTYELTGVYQGKVPTGTLKLPKDRTHLTPDMDFYAPSYDYKTLAESVQMWLTK